MLTRFNKKSTCAEDRMHTFQIIKKEKAKKDVKTRFKSTSATCSRLNLAINKDDAYPEKKQPKPELLDII